VACECDDAATAFPKCHLRLSDNSAWLFASNDLAEPDAWGECTEEQVQASSFSCDFRQCENPPPVTCSRDVWCGPEGCYDGLKYDNQGCIRTTCDSDSDCDDEERCIQIDCDTSGQCDYNAYGVCYCRSALACNYPSYCNPVAAVGPRGQWQTLEIIQGAGPCPPDETCTWRWTITPDGQVDYDKNGVTGTVTLNQVDLDILKKIIDGTELRVALRDGIPCDGPPTDIGVSFRLVLDSQTLERSATGCAISGPTGNVFWELYRRVKQF